MFETSGLGQKEQSRREGLRSSKNNKNVQDLSPPQLFNQIRRIIVGVTMQPLIYGNIDPEARSLVVYSLDRNREV
jgi:hypothetical protein